MAVIKNWYAYCSFLLFIFIGASVCNGAKYYKEKTSIVYNHKFVIQYIAENKNVEVVEESLLSLSAAIVKNYEDYYGIRLPESICFVIHPKADSYGAYAATDKNTIHIYKIFGKDSLGLFDLLILTHEFGHMVMGTTEDRILNETWATYLEYESLQEFYKKQGRKFPKAMFNQAIANIYKDDDLYVILKETHEQYGPKNMGKVLQVLSNEYLDTNNWVLLPFIRKAFLTHLKDSSFIRNYNKIRELYYVPELKIKLKELNEEKTEMLQKMGYNGGVYVAWAWGGGPFYPIVRHDILLSVDGNNVSNINAVKMILQEKANESEPWETITLEVLRGGAKQTISTKLELFISYNPMGFFNRKVKISQESTPRCRTYSHSDTHQKYLNGMCQFIEDMYISLSEEFEIDNQNRPAFILEILPENVVDRFIYHLANKNEASIFTPPSEEIAYYIGIPSLIMKDNANIGNKTDFPGYVRPYLNIYSTILINIFHNFGVFDGYLEGLMRYMFRHGLTPKLRQKYDKDLFIYFDNYLISKNIPKEEQMAIELIQQILLYIGSTYGNKVFGSFVNAINEEPLKDHPFIYFKDFKRFLEANFKDPQLNKLLAEYEIVYERN